MPEMAKRKRRIATTSLRSCDISKPSKLFNSMERLSGKDRDHILIQINKAAVNG
ncbi:hypothetical protein GCM10027567_08910 [Spongiibacter taiwanensis]